MGKSLNAEPSGRAFLRGLRVGIPICLGYFAVAIALGITARSAGMNAVQSGIMSATMLASAGEFAAVTMISTSAGIIEMITTTIIVNLRYLLMSSALSQKLSDKTPFWHRFLLAYCVTDEIFGVSIAEEGTLNPVYTYGVTIISAIGWTSGTVLGVLIGNILPARLINALSVALYGMFLAVIIPATGGPTSFPAAIPAIIVDAGVAIISIGVSLDTILPHSAAITAITATVDTPASLDVDSTDYSNGKVTVKVPNTKESNLPTTGGMGTKMFYIGGAVLMAVAAIALVVKKKLSRI